MRKTKISGVILAFLLILLFSVNVYATDEEWTDLSKAKVEVTQTDKRIGGWEYTLKVTGVTFKDSKDIMYNVYLKNEDTTPDFSKTEDLAGTLNKEGQADVTVKLNNLFEKSGKIYCWIVETNVDKKGTPYKTEIARLSQHKLGNRMEGYFFASETMIHMREAISADSERKVNVKVGTITDQTILKSIKNGEANCLQKLLTYAKSASPIYTGSVKLGNGNDSITSKMNLVNEAYYYVYMELDTEGGKYYPVEDVSLYQAGVSGEGRKNLFDYLDENFKWNLENEIPETTTKQDETKVAKTTDNTAAKKRILDAGSTYVIFALIVIITLSVILASKNKKYRGI